MPDTYILTYDSFLIIGVHLIKFKNYFCVMFYCCSFLFVFYFIFSTVIKLPELNHLMYPL